MKPIPKNIDGYSSSSIQLVARLRGHTTLSLDNSTQVSQLVHPDIAQMFPSMGHFYSTTPMQSLSRIGQNALLQAFSLKPLFDLSFVQSNPIPNV